MEEQPDDDNGFLEIELLRGVIGRLPIGGDGPRWPWTPPENSDAR